MTTTATHPPQPDSPPTAPRPAVRRGGAGRVRSWTGRSATSRATDSALSRLAIAGTRRTRVSEMRFSTARPRHLSRQGEVAGPGATSTERSRAAGQRPAFAAG